MPSRNIPTPTGSMLVTEENGALVRARWSDAPAQDDTPLLRMVHDQVTAYFDGQLTRFDLPLQLSVSPTQRAICDAMMRIPFGETRRYKDLAKDLNLPPQAIGQGCGGNPIPLIIPCHRVLSSTGLGGFSGGDGIETKVALLKHEGAASLLL